MYDKCMNTAGRILSCRQYSRNEMKRKLHDKGFADEEIEAVLLKLEEYKLIDDMEYAKSYVRGFLAKNRSKRVIKYELSKRLINADIIEEVIENIDDKEQLEKLIAKKFPEADVDDYIQKQKIYQYIRSKGF